jgi:hypothetical protein
MASEQYIAAPSPASTAEVTLSLGLRKTVSFNPSSNLSESPISAAFKSTDGTLIVKRAPKGTPALSNEQAVLEHLATTSFKDKYNNQAIASLTEGDQDYLILQYLPGVPIASLIRNPTDHPLELSKLLSIIISLFNSTKTINASDVLQKDIHPGNFIWDSSNGLVSPIDFGEAFISRQRSVNTTIGNVVEGYNLYTAKSRYTKQPFFNITLNKSSTILYNTNTEWFSTILIAQDLAKAYFDVEKNADKKEQLSILINILERELNLIASLQSKLQASNLANATENSADLYDPKGVCSLIFLLSATNKARENQAQDLWTPEQICLDIAIEAVINQIKMENTGSNQKLSAIQQEFVGLHREVKKITKDNKDSPTYQKCKQNFDGLNIKLKPLLSPEGRNLVTIISDALDRFLAFLRPTHKANLSTEILENSCRPAFNAMAAAERFAAPSPGVSKIVETPA